MEVQVGYVKAFAFVEDAAQEALDPHPIVGRIYRIIKIGYKKQ